jgi:hypothetical protein
MGGHHTRSGRFGEQKNPYPYQDSNPQIIQSVAELLEFQKETEPKKNVYKIYKIFIC